VRSVWLVLLLRVALVLAIVASAALVVEYQNPGDPAFCGVGSGCHQVRIAPQTREFSEMLRGVSLPQLGLVAYLALLAVSLLARTLAYHVTLAAMAVPGALFAGYLLYVQKAQIGVWCPWCVLVDSSAIVVGIASALVALDARSSDAQGNEQRTELTSSKPALVGWAVAGALAVGLPFVWGAYPVVPPAPPDLAALATPGKVTIVQFTDFQCPFCRKLHPLLEALRHEHEGRIVYQRRMKPLTMHPGALPAALAYLCVPEPQRDAMADALYTAGEKDLTPAGVARIAGGLGVDATTFASCVESPDTKARLEQDTSLYERVGPRGLPLTFVNARTIVGFDSGKVTQAVKVEVAGGRIGLPTWSLFLVVGAATALAATLTWQNAARRRRQASERQ
jgi:protein-disulfide isomerase